MRPPAALGARAALWSRPCTHDEGRSPCEQPPTQLGAAGPGTLTPSDEEEEPLAQALGGVGHGDGRVQVAALYEHPEEVSHHEVVEDGGDAAAPDLHGAGSGQGRPRLGPRGAAEGRSCWGFVDPALKTLKSHPGKVRPLSCP